MYLQSTYVQLSMYVCKYEYFLVRTPTPSQILSPGSLNNTEWGGIHDVPKTQN